MSLNKSRVKKLEEKSTQADKKPILAVCIDGIIEYKGIEYTREEFLKVYKNADLIDVEFID